MVPPALGRHHLGPGGVLTMLFFKKKRVELGTGYIMAYTLFESKHLFSIIFYNWLTIEQNRFHSHAFPAVAFLLSGSYEEEYLDLGQVKINKVNAWMKPRYLPRNYTHRIMVAAPRTWTVVFVGPWSDNWYEWFQDSKVWVKYGWGRKVIDKSHETPLELISYSRKKNNSLREVENHEENQGKLSERPQLPQLPR